MERTIGEVSQLFGITQRTLRHWDDLGLACPTYRDWNDYRLYTEADIERIQQVMVYRAVGFPLATIQQLLDDPTADPAVHLRRQREALLKQRAGIDSMIQSLDTLLEDTMQPKLTPEQKAQILGKFWDPDIQAEAEQRWGNTPEWQQAETKKAAMTAQDWEHVRDDAIALEAQLSKAFTSGIKPGSAKANALAEQHLQSIAQWFQLSYEKHVLIARGYTSDPRFAAYYDQIQPGLSSWLRQVIEANAQAHGVDIATAQWH